MEENLNEADRLGEKLDLLLKRQEIFSREINEIREEIKRLKASGFQQPSGEQVKIGPLTSGEIRTDAARITAAGKPLNNQAQILKQPVMTSPQEEKRIIPAKADLEKFIGENLINKIGIVITVIGVAIGAKYAIEHQLISPWTRIISGYIFGLVLLGFSLPMKKTYQNFSAVLLSGSMAIMYFITYAAYSFYDLIPQIFAFSLMVFFTAFTVTAALNYGKQVIAHIGLVGAYAIPFLLGRDSDNVSILFSYTAIINIGILIISFKKYWKPLYYSSFLLTWIMYLTWFGSGYKAAEHFGVSSAFLLIFFLTFYMMFLAYKLLQKEKFDFYDVILLLANSFIFFGTGCKILSDHYPDYNILGLFTLCNALVHLTVSFIIYREKLADRNLFYLVSGLALIFITITIPVQLNGNWVTLLWAGEAALLFWIGRTRQVRFYENLSYALIFLALISLLQDWSGRYATVNKSDAVMIRPLFNTGFLTSILFAISMGFVNFLNYTSKYPSPFVSKEDLKNFVSFSISTVFLIVLYFSFQVEISLYFNQLYQASVTEIKVAGQEFPTSIRNSDILKFKNIWLLNYSFFFLFVCSIFNIKIFRNSTSGYINIFLNTFLILIFLLYGLFILSELREDYLSQTLSENYPKSHLSIGIRYITLAFASLMFVSLRMYKEQRFMHPEVLNQKIAFDMVLYISLVWILSSELLSWMDLFGYTQSYKLALSILWGLSALFLIILGIWRVKKHLRVTAIALFAVTLIKLFSYDLSHLNTISKTIVFITLGVLLLIISFLYNKYKNVITGQGII